MNHRFVVCSAKNDGLARVDKIVDESCTKTIDFDPKKMGYGEPHACSGQCACICFMIVILIVVMVIFGCPICLLLTG